MDIYYKLAKKIVWTKQTPEEAEKEAGKALILAGWLKWSEKNLPDTEL
jgi:hypothetical protein